MAIQRRRALRSAYRPTRRLRFDFDRGENQGSVAIARTPASSMARSRARANGPWRSNHRPSRSSPRPAVVGRVRNQDVRADQVSQDRQDERALVPSRGTKKGFEKISRRRGWIGHASPGLRPGSRRGAHDPAETQPSPSIP